jgi:hypothetical protein
MQRNNSIRIRCWVPHRSSARTMLGFVDFERPLMAGVGAYPAGPFTKPDSRRGLIAAPGQSIAGDGMICACRHHPGHAFVRRLEALRASFDATGPWQRHTHGHDGHGVITGRGDGFCRCYDGDSIVNICQQAVANSDLFFVWLLEVDTVPAGTLCEIGYVAALGQPVVMARPGDGDDYYSSDYWFPIAAADWCLHAETAAEASKNLVDDSAWSRSRRRLAEQPVDARL